MPFTDEGNHNIKISGDFIEEVMEIENEIFGNGAIYNLRNGRVYN